MATVVPAIPTPEQLREALQRLGPKGCKALAQRSGVPVETIDKIRLGETTDPGIKRVGRFWPHLLELQASAPAPAELMKAAPAAA